MAFTDLIRGRHRTAAIEAAWGLGRDCVAPLLGSAVSPAMTDRPVARKRRRLSAYACAAISRAQKLRWAKQRAEKK
jgi:hypothetical protein